MYTVLERTGVYVIFKYPDILHRKSKGTIAFCNSIFGTTTALRYNYRRLYTTKMENRNFEKTVTASAVVAESAAASYAEDAEIVTVAVVESLPMAHASVATAVPTASMPPTNDNDDDDVKAKYAMYDYSHDDEYVVHEATAGVASLPTNTIPYNTPYSTQYDPDLERRIAQEATRRGRMLSEQEIQDIRRINSKADAINNHEKHKVALANQNAFYQNYKEETGLTQTSSTIPYEAVAVPTTSKAASEPAYFPGGTYGTSGYEISEYETSNYDTKDYECNEYKSVYDP